MFIEALVGALSADAYGLMRVVQPWGQKRTGRLGRRERKMTKQFRRWQGWRLLSQEQRISG